MDTKPQLPAIVAKPDLPDIEVTPNIKEMARKAVEALGADADIFQRSGALVHVANIQDRPEPVEGVVAIRPTSTPTIRQLKLSTLTAHLSADAYWKKRDDGKWKDVTPPPAVVSAVMDQGEWPGVPVLTAVTTSPTLRPDGSVLQQSGYDRVTGLLYQPGAITYPIVDDKPTRDQCMWHKEALLEIVRDFPFSKLHHVSAWFAAMLTCVARPAIDGPCPLFAVDATTAGTGKGRLVQATARMVFGQDVAAFSQPEDEDEIRKRITSILLQGDPCVLIDNVNKPLGGAALDAVLTSTTWADRMLGTTSTVKVQNLSVWWATGNNVQLLGDMARRTMQIRLESNLEKPEERDNFVHKDLLAWIDRERPKLVVNALSILRGYFVAGKPCKTKPWGSFESWSDLVPGVIRWLDMEDPQLARATADDMIDEDRQNLLILIMAIEKLDSRREGLTARTIIARLFPPRERNEPYPEDGNDDVREAIEGITRCPPGRTPEASRFAKYLQKRRGRVLAGRRIERASIDGDSNSIRWTVVKVEARPPNVIITPKTP